MQKEIKFIDADKFAYHVQYEMKFGCRFWGNILDDLKEFPAADVAPIIHAHWELVGQTYNSYEHKCSRCHRTVFTSSAVKIENINAVYPYCHCGAKMDEEEN